MTINIKSSYIILLKGKQKFCTKLCTEDPTIVLTVELITRNVAWKKNWDFQEGTFLDLAEKEDWGWLKGKVFRTPLDDAVSLKWHAWCHFWNGIVATGQGGRGSAPWPPSIHYLGKGRYVQGISFETRSPAGLLYYTCNPTHKRDVRPNTTLLQNKYDYCSLNINFLFFQVPWKNPILE